MKSLSLDKAQLTPNQELAERVRDVCRRHPEFSSHYGNLVEDILEHPEDISAYYLRTGDTPEEFDGDDRLLLEVIIEEKSTHFQVLNHFKTIPQVYDGDTTVKISSNGYLAPASKPKPKREQLYYPEGNPDNEDSRWQDLGRFCNDHPQ